MKNIYNDCIFFFYWVGAGEGSNYEEHHGFKLGKKHQWILVGGQSKLEKTNVRDTTSTIHNKKHPLGLSIKVRANSDICYSPTAYTHYVFAN